MYNSYKEIKHQYCDLNYYIKDIAKNFNVPAHQIAGFIRKNKWIRNYMDKNWLKENHHIKQLNIQAMSKKANCSVDTISRWMRKHEVEMLQEVRYKNLGKSYSLNESFFEVIDTEEKAYWLGFITADGCINITDTSNRHKTKVKYFKSYKAYRLSILLSRTDKSHLYKFKKDIKYTGIIEEGNTFVKSKKYPNAKVRITSEKLCKDLMRNGIMPRKSSKENFPHFLTDDLLRHFIRGYFDGDGCFTYRKNPPYYSPCVTFVGGNTFLKELKVYLKSNVIEKTKGKIKDSNTYSTYSIGGVNLVIQFMDWIYNDATVYLDRKYKLYNEWKTLRKI